MACIFIHVGNVSLLVEVSAVEVQQRLPVMWYASTLVQNNMQAVALPFFRGLHTVSAHHSAVLPQQLTSAQAATALCIL